MVDQMTEVERKYDVAPEVRTPDLSELPGVVHVDPPLDLEQVATYFDTADLRLLAARMTLRHRTGGVDDGWHLKVPARDEGRDEIHLAASGSDEPPEPPAALLDRVRGVVRDNPVTPVAVLRTRRRLVRLHGEAGVLAEFCDDHVAAESPMEPSLTQEWREWEMELVQGSDELLTAAEPLLRDAGARPAASASKLARALAPMVPEQDSWRHRQEPGEASTTTELLSAYLAQHLARLQEEDSALRAGDREGVHKLRVAARRMRSALATYRPVLQPDSTTTLRADLKWLGGMLAEARDAQVLRERLTRLLDGQPEELVLGPVRSRLDDELRAKLKAGRVKVDAALNSGRYLRLLDRLEDFIEEPPANDEGRRRAHAALPDLLAKDLKRTHKRARSHADANPEHHDLALHEVRKAAKRLRYAAESARPTFGKQAKRLASRAEALQTLLGEHQDSVVARPVLREIGVRAFLAGENGFTFGRLHALEEAHAGELERAYPDALSGLPAKKLRKWLGK